MGDLGALPDEELLELWDDTTDFTERDRILEELERRELFPRQQITQWEAETGAYPLFGDPEFLQKLLAKREFAESLQTTWKPEDDPCGDENKFEVTPVQRFVANLMSPKSPYMSALLYHGVGVGKTCAAVQIAEAWLETFPRDKVILVTPPTIQQGFYRTIFDINRVKVAEEEGVPNTAVGCTGSKYMSLTGTLLERDKTRIQRRVLGAIRRRYAFYGYISFANHVRDLLKAIPKTATEERRAKLEADIIRRAFSGKMLIVDEAHNLRDLPDDIADEEEDGPGGATEKTDAVAGKLLTPFLRKVLMYAEGMKLVLLTATPMYNTYREIIFILNLLLMNDKRALLNESDIFDSRGRFRNNDAKERLGAVARHYVSFMRGENPVSFPIRLKPMDIPAIRSSTYPRLNPRGAEVADSEKIFVDHLPIVPVQLTGDTLRASLAFTGDLPAGEGGLNTILLEKLVHAGNFIVPATEETAGDDVDSYRARTDIDSLATVFTRETVGGEVRYRARPEVGARWLGLDQLEQYSTKFVTLLRRLKTSEGVDFIYTRFVSGGAIPLALVLEANGYTPVGRKLGLLADGIQTPGGRQCALCDHRETEHRANAGLGHDFAPAYYGLLTGDVAISPRNEDVIKRERALDNANGMKMKIIIGSQIASEGVDLRFIREIHVLDSWFHLNKTEQILGRGIRFCSHSALPREKRNTTIYLYAATLPAELQKESADLYSYRIAFRKALQVGRVSRVLKENAIDCNLNHDAIIIAGQERVRQIDSQRRERPDVNINDMPFTAVCDWTECAYDCKPKIDVVPSGTDDSTYSEFAARWRENSLRERLRALFAIQPSYRDEDLIEMLDVPQPNIAELLLSVVDNRMFQVTHDGIAGYIRYCNHYFIFQPNVYGDLSIPMALRVTKIPVRRDAFVPQIRAIEDIEVELTEGAPAEEGEEEVAETEEMRVHGLREAWHGIVEWCTGLADSEVGVKVPEVVYQRIRKMSKGDGEVETKLRQITEMVLWFHRAFHSSGRKRADKMRLALLEFFWDHWFTMEEQRLLVRAGATGVNTMIDYAVYHMGRINIMRYVNPMDGSLLYLCEDGEPCRKAYVDAVERDKSDDPMKRIDLTERRTGKIYGFMVPKNGSMVFKTNEPIATAGAKPGRGAECAIVSNMTEHLKKLYSLGEILERAGMTDFQLNNIVLLGTHKVIHANRACCLLELVLRYMDKLILGDKHWFYRPVASYYTGHKGLFRIGTKSGKKPSGAKPAKVTKSRNE
jgi:hypothetical protein